MPVGKRKRPLASWSDDEKHKAIQSPQRQDEQSQEGSMTDPEEVESKDVLDRAKEMGLYSGADPQEETQPEVDVAKEEQKDVDNEY